MIEGIGAEACGSLTRSSDAASVSAALVAISLSCSRDAGAASGSRAASVTVVGTEGVSRPGTGADGGGNAPRRAANCWRISARRPSICWSRAVAFLHGPERAAGGQKHGPVPPAPFPGVRAYAVRVSEASFRPCLLPVLPPPRFQGWDADLP